MKPYDIARLFTRLAALFLLVYCVIDLTLLGPYLRTIPPHLQPWSFDILAAILRAALNLLGALVLFRCTDGFIRRMGNSDGESMTTDGFALFLMRAAAVWMWWDALYSVSYLDGYVRAYHHANVGTPAVAATAENYHAEWLRIFIFVIAGVAMWTNAEAIVARLLGRRTVAG